MRRASLEDAQRISDDARSHGLSIRLCYSKPKAESSGHLRYEIELKNGVVADIDDGLYID